MATKPEREIRWGLLENIADRETVAFAKHTDLMAFNYVGGEGERPPEVMVIGQNPGAQEDVRKRPFVGASGIIQRMLLVRSGLFTKDTSARKEVIKANCWLTNAIKFRTPGNRLPTEEEIELARPYLRQEWEAIGQPSIVVCVGRVAARAVTGTNEKQHTAMACEFINSYGAPMYVWFMTHPSVAVRDKGMATVLQGQWERFERWFLG
jgi:uracil-DNA glycosylase family 4